MSITATTTLKAIAYETGMTNSADDFRGLHHPVRRPAFSPAAGTYSTAHSVTITTTTGGATIRYTTNGTTPTETVGTVYSSAVNISVNTTLQAIAYKTGLTDSTMASGVYTIQCAARASARRRALTPPRRGNHHHDHRWRDHPLHHRRQHAERDRRHGVQQRGEHHRHQPRCRPSPIRPA